MIILHGVGLDGGIAIGKAYVLDHSIDYAMHVVLDDGEVEPEVYRFKEALKSTKRELELIRDNITHDAPPELASLISLNILMLNDSQIANAPVEIIRKEKCHVEWAIKLQAEYLSERFDAIKDEYLKERKQDVLQVLERIFKNLEGNKFDWDLDGKLENGILVTHDLSPADLVNFRNSNFSGFVIEIGSLTSHTTIISKNLDIPALVGTPYARRLVREDDILILDSIQGVLIINPEELILDQYKNKQQLWLKNKAKLSIIRSEKSRTKDGIAVELLSNIDNAEDINEVKYSNASGIGLFRSELLYLRNKNHLLGEDEQFEVYSGLAKAMKKLPVVIRTADFGADKNPLWNISTDESLNPALGLTGIRLSLTEPGFFRTQLRAILRASYFGNVRILFPMISSALELTQALYQLEYAKSELEAEGVSFNGNIKVGVMIEIPSAAFAIKSILSLVDFISIGTNDLIQFLLAIDRNDEAVKYLYNPLHPAVLKILFHIIRNANRVGVPVSICGEIAGDIHMTRLLLVMGLRSFSMYCANILKVKSVVLNTHIDALTPIVAKILKTEDVVKIEELVYQLNDGIKY